MLPAASTKRRYAVVVLEAAVVVDQPHEHRREVAEGPDLFAEALQCALEPVAACGRRCASASGMRGQDLVATAPRSSGSLTPPGTTHAGWIRFPPSHSMICWPNWRRRMPSRASSGMLLHHAEDVALGRIAVHARAAGPGDDRWKKLSACDCTICARFMMRRSLTAVSRNAHGQDGIAGLGGGQQVAAPGRCRRCAPSAKAFRRTAGPRRISRSRGTGSRGSAHPPRVPASSRWIVILACPSMRVTGSMMIVCMLALLAPNWLAVSAPACVPASSPLRRE